MKQTRQTLIARLRDQHDEESWETFAQIYRRYIYVVIRRMNLSHSEAEDLVQEILFKVWNKLPELNYNPHKARFRTWLSTVIKNHVISYIRSSQSHSNKLSKAAEEMNETYSDHEIDEIIRKEWENYISNMAMERIKKSFPGQALKVFEMSLEGKSVAEIAETLNLKENSVYKSKNRVKARLIEEISLLRSDLE
ncbi:probable extracytoplasmic function alternative sigma factor [Lentisphaera araneosa HTCC2155]|jgi:RNA polymerase sigma factor (sigma-70 family)|uniref:Probable extracytoplasmic function alternative sigma factor n=1 Tax=Lentisphaera araneosa HTCC2155 TaxID=313628 RepID=A6DRY0_9BACT|nr:sigma-70 family RNA polymerase sigma factor [Lentisphaera araneosa]EDM25555.1 probable extracytoplasmic function alternative sigma factor [Lentisphaera araneosa HTCC2155]